MSYLKRWKTPTFRTTPQEISRLSFGLIWLRFNIFLQFKQWFWRQEKYKNRCINLLHNETFIYSLYYNKKVIDYVCGFIPNFKDMIFKNKYNNGLMTVLKKWEVATFYPLGYSLYLYLDCRVEVLSRIYRCRKACWY